MDAITRVQPLLDELKPKEKKNRLDDPMLQSFLDYIDQYMAKVREQHKTEDVLKAEARRIQAEFDKKLAFLKGMVEAAFQAMMGTRMDLPPGASSPEEKEYYYWVAQLQSFKQQGRIAGLL